MSEMRLFPPQLCSVRTCGPIWSPPTRRSTRAPPWGPSPPRPSLSAWTTKQRTGGFPCLTLCAVCGLKTTTCGSRGLEDEKGSLVNMHCPTHAHGRTRPHNCHLTSHGHISDVRHGAGDSAGLHTYTIWTDQ